MPNQITHTLEDGSAEEVIQQTVDDGSGQESPARLVSNFIGDVTMQNDLTVAGTIRAGLIVAPPINTMQGEIANLDDDLDDLSERIDALEVAVENIGSGGSGGSGGGGGGGGGSIDYEEADTHYLIKDENTAQTVQGRTTFARGIVTNAASQMNGNVSVTGDVAATGQVQGNTIVGTTNVHSNGTLTSDGNISTQSGSISTNSGNITSLNGTIQGKNVHATTALSSGGTLSVAGNASVQGDLTVNGTITATDAHITHDLDVDNHVDAKDITVETLTVTKAAHFFELVIDQLRAQKGAIIITSGQCVADDVETITGGWRVWYRADEGTAQAYQSFMVGDLAICQRFGGAHVGTMQNVTTKYYWRKVTGVSNTAQTRSDGKAYHYIDLSNVSGEYDTFMDSAPAKGDEIVQLGFQPPAGTGADVTQSRQSAIIMSAYPTKDTGITPPSLAFYQDIDGFALGANQRKTYFAANGSVIDGSITIGGESIVDYIDRHAQAEGQSYRVMKYAWSTQSSTSGVEVAPTISGTWSDSIPTKPSSGTYYLWMQVTPMEWNTTSGTYVAGTPTYACMSGQKGDQGNPGQGGTAVLPDMYKLVDRGSYCQMRYNVTYEIEWQLYFAISYFDDDHQWLIADAAKVQDLESDQIFVSIRKVKFTNGAIAYEPLSALYPQAVAGEACVLSANRQINVGTTAVEELMGIEVTLTDTSGNIYDRQFVAMGITKSTIFKIDTVLGQIEGRCTDVEESVEGAWDKVDSFESRLTQKADLLQLQTVQQSVESINGEITNIKRDYSTRTQTAQDINTAVTQYDATIRDHVATQVNNLSSSINQTAASIRSEVSQQYYKKSNDPNEDPVLALQNNYSTINQTAESISLSVGELRAAANLLPYSLWESYSIARQNGWQSVIYSSSGAQYSTQNIDTLPSPQSEYAGYLALTSNFTAENLAQFSDQTSSSAVSFGANRTIRWQLNARALNYGYDVLTLSVVVKRPAGFLSQEKVHEDDTISENPLFTIVIQGASEISAYSNDSNASHWAHVVASDIRNESYIQWNIGDREEHRVWVTFKLDSHCTSSHIGFRNNWSVQRNEDAGGTESYTWTKSAFVITKPKLEHSSVVTDWCEDVSWMSRTGIDVESGKITLDADTVEVARDLTIGGNTRVGGFVYNLQKEVSAAIVHKCKNPYDYGNLDCKVTQSGSVAPYDTANILFPECGSSLIFNTDSLLAGEPLAQRLTGVGIRKININLPFHNSYAKDVSNVRTMGNIYSLCTDYKSISGYAALGDVPEITGEDTPNLMCTKFLVEQIANGADICRRYLGSTVTIENRFVDTDVCPIYVYGVKDVVSYDDSLNGSTRWVKLYRFEPWNRGTQCWNFNDPNSGTGAWDSLPGEAECKRYVDMLWPALVGNYERIPSGSRSKTISRGFDSNSILVTAQQVVDSSAFNGCFCVKDSQDASSFASIDANGIYAQANNGDGLRLPFVVPVGWFCRLRLTYSNGNFFWIVESLGQL